MNRVIYLIFITTFLIQIPIFSGDLPKPEKRIEENAILSLLEGLRSENLGLKTSCAYMLGELKISDAVIPLMKILKDDENEQARISSALALYKIGTPLAIFAVRQAIKFDESPRVSKLASNFYNEHLRNKMDNDNIDNDSTYVTLK